LPPLKLDDVRFAFYQIKVLQSVLPKFENDIEELSQFVNFGTWQNILNMTEKQFVTDYADVDYSAMLKDDGAQAKIERERIKALWPTIALLQRLHLTPDRLADFIVQYQEAAEAELKPKGLNDTPESNAAALERLKNTAERNQQHAEAVQAAMTPKEIRQNRRDDRRKAARDAKYEKQRKAQFGKAIEDSRFPAWHVHKHNIGIAVIIASLLALGTEFKGPKLYSRSYKAITSLFADPAESSNNADAPIMKPEIAENSTDVTKNTFRTIYDPIESQIANVLSTVEPYMSEVSTFLENAAEAKQGDQQVDHAEQDNALIALESQVDNNSTSDNPLAALEANLNVGAVSEGENPLEALTKQLNTAKNSSSSSPLEFLESLTKDDQSNSHSNQ